jgi:hypothetical protein
MRTPTHLPRTACPNLPIFDVHIIAHTHDDTGYLSTIEEYYQSNVKVLGPLQLLRLYPHAPLTAISCARSFS